MSNKLWILQGEDKQCFVDFIEKASGAEFIKYDDCIWFFISSLSKEQLRKLAAENFNESEDEFFLIAIEEGYINPRPEIKTWLANKGMFENGE